MLNGHFTLTPDGSRRATLSWTTADAALLSWVFVNGAKLYGPLFLETAERSVPVPLPAGECRAIEVHDLPVGGIAGPVFETPTTRPAIQWNPVPQAQRYRLYHREGNGVERRLLDRPATDFRGTPIRIDSPVEFAGVGGVWHFLRVEAVDRYGNESTRLAWRWFAVAPPLAPSRIDVAEGTGPGLFTVTVTP
jgi:hypothetical protein